MIWRAQIQEQPQYQHDSESCIFMGTYSIFSFKTYDLWFNPIERSIIARFGEDDAYYCLNKDLIPHIKIGKIDARPCLKEGLRRAELFKFI